MSTYGGNAAPSQRVPTMPSSWADRLAIGMQDPLLLLARVLLGAIFVQSGFGKLTNLGGFIGNLANQGVPAPSVFGTIGACVEFFGGLAIVLGAWTRVAAVLMVGFTAAATLIAHRYWAAPDAQRTAQHIQFMKNLAIIGGFVGLIAAGAGRFSVDGFRRRDRR
jgi:putative oxidoreductase